MAGDIFLDRVKLSRAQDRVSMVDLSRRLEQAADLVSVLLERRYSPTQCITLLRTLADMGAIRQVKPDGWVLKKSIQSLPEFRDVIQWDIDALLPPAVQRTLDLDEMVVEGLGVGVDDTVVTARNVLGLMLCPADSADREGREIPPSILAACEPGALIGVYHARRDQRLHDLRAEGRSVSSSNPSSLAATVGK